MENNFSKATLRVYKDICAFFDSVGYEYTTDSESLRVFCVVSGDDLDIDLKISVGSPDGFISVYSPMPYTVAKDKRALIAEAVSIVNFSTINGSFDFDLEGNLGFRITQCYFDSILDESVYDYLINLSVEMIDRFNDKFLLMSLGKYSIEDLKGFIKP